MCETVQLIQGSHEFWLQLVIFIYQSQKNELKQRHSRQSHRQTSNDGLHDFSRNICNDRSTYPRCFLMENNNTKRNIDPQKTSAEKLNGRFALVGVIALVGAYISTGQIVPGII